MPVIVNARFLTQPLSGVQRHCLEISKQLQTQFAPQELLFVAPPTVRHAKEAEALNVTLIPGQTGHVWEQVTLPTWLAKQRFKGRLPPLLNMGNTMPFTYTNGLLTIHDVSFLNRAWVSWKFSMFYRLLLPRLAKKAQKLVTVSQFSRQELAPFLSVPEESISVIYNGVSPNLAQLAKTGQLPNEVTQSGKPYILAVSSLDPRKNFPRLIEAFKQLNHPDLMLYIAGGREAIYNNQHLSQLLKEAPNIALLGRVSDETLAVLYRHAKLFVFPSLYEGFGLPPLEAMSCGCPTLVSRNSSLPEICGEASAYIEDPTNVSELADAIAAVLEDEPLRQTLIHKGFQQAEKFTWEHSGTQYAALIQHLL
jgi:glycosyltransferase involved in cell wall biosynthesis